MIGSGESQKLASLLNHIFASASNSHGAGNGLPLTINLIPESKKLFATFPQHATEMDSA